MSEPRQTQKQISQEYTGAADYPGRAHYFRRLRLWLFLGTAAAAVLGLLVYSVWGGRESYSPGAISQNHSRFANDCQVCHLNATRMGLEIGSIMPSGGHVAGTGGSITGMDIACAQCHATACLHGPQAETLRVRAFSPQFTVVHATGCAGCHREHAGRDRMALPGQESCVVCHNDAQALAAVREARHLPAKPIAATGENKDLGDGVVRFLTPELPPEAIPTFARYDQGHPAFAWEQPGARDPAALKFNHRRHFRSDIPQFGSHRLTCTDCHVAGPDGAFMQPVRYQQHCAQCHTLQFQPSLPKLTIPHGDPEKVRYFLASREVAFALAIRAEGVTDATALTRRVETEMKELEKRVLAKGRGVGTSAASAQGDLLALEKRVFFEGDPPDRPDDHIGRASVPKFLTACSKCHDVSEGTPEKAPKVAVPNIAQRWTQHGPFTHRPHGHMRCIDCHGAALQSTETRDILLPSQKLCAECHRQPVLSTDAMMNGTAGGFDAQSSSQQRAHGGISWDCTACHSFHAPPNAQTVLQKLPPEPTLSHFP